MSEEDSTKARLLRDYLKVDTAVLKDGTLTVRGWLREFRSFIAHAEMRFADVVVQLDNGMVDQGVVSDLRRFEINVVTPRRINRSYLEMFITHKDGESLRSVWPVSIEQVPHELGVPTSIDNRNIVVASRKSNYKSKQARFANGWIINKKVTVVYGHLPYGQLLVEDKNGARHPLSSCVRGDANPVNSATHGSRADHRSRVMEWCVAGSGPDCPSESVIALSNEDHDHLEIVLEPNSQVARTQIDSLCANISANEAVDLIAACIAACRDDGSIAETPEWLEHLMHAQLSRLPVLLDVTTPRVLINCDSATLTANEGVVLRGWFFSPSTDVSAIFYSDEYVSSRIDNVWTKHSRGDVTTHLAGLGLHCNGDRHGFSCFVPLSLKPLCGHLLIKLVTGKTLRAKLPPLGSLDSMAAIREILASFSNEDRGAFERLDSCVGPAIRAIWSHQSKRGNAVHAEDFGSKSEDAKISIIVPLYARHDLAEYQLAQFANDPEMKAHELIYFVDDPSIFDDFRLRCRDLYEIYRVPFVLAHAGANFGFSGANNRAASIARGRYLLLLNSDVFPTAPGWLNRMLETYSRQEDCGVLGVKLLYEDKGAQHVGITFKRYPLWGDMWINEHRSRGRPSDHFFGVQEVHAVTAACALIDAALFRTVGGLSEDYVIGDFEDSDLCLKLLREGKRNYVLLDEALFHLERQSLSRVGESTWRENLTFYNCWQHHCKWAEQIEKLQT